MCPRVSVLVRSCVNVLVCPYVRVSVCQGLQQDFVYVFESVRECMCAISYVLASALTMFAR